MPYTVYSVRYEEVDVPVSARDDRRADQARQRLVEFLNEGGHATARKSTLALRHRKRWLLSQMQLAPDSLRASLVERFSRCGKANCHCHAEPPELHGPYLQWSYTLQNKRFTRWFTPEQEERYRPRIKAARRLRELVTELERLEILSAERAEGWGT